MIRKGFLIAALAALFSLPTTSKAEVVNPWEITIGGGGSNSSDFDGFNASANGSLGYYFTDNLELSLRQSVSYSDFAGSDWNGSTRVAFDVHFPLGSRGHIVPFVGANIGYVYGDSVNDTWAAAPEAGIKIYFDTQTFVFFTAEYQFFFEEADSDDLDAAFDDGAFVYTIGLGFRF